MTIERKLSKKLQCLENIHIFDTEKEDMSAIIVIKNFTKKYLLPQDTTG